MGDIEHAEDIATATDTFLIYNYSFRNVYFHALENKQETLILSLYTLINFDPKSLPWGILILMLLNNVKTLNTSLQYFWSYDFVWILAEMYRH